MTSSSPYVGYAYSYPHKTAYRTLEPPVDLASLWAEENRQNLFLYIHIPFCEMRCGFCNLFTTSNPEQEFTGLYMEALRRQSRVVGEALGDARYSRMAIGGGTPTYLDAKQLESLFGMVDSFRKAGAVVPISVETSPRTAELDRLKVLRDHGVSRISMGVQSFVEEEVVRLGRAQKNEWVERAIGHIRSLEFPVLNLDLIYGAAGQTVQSWMASLHAALDYSPEELYLYPLYVRPLTGLGKRDLKQEDLRLECYRAARDLLIGKGYNQVSMRMFRRSDVPDAEMQTEYSCQEDGMIGLGCGARSYSTRLHYSTEYAVGAGGVRSIIDAYVGTSDEGFARASYGVYLTEEDRRRRWVLKSLLRVEGLDVAAYETRFGSSPRADFPLLEELEAEGLAMAELSATRLTPRGMEQSDAIGPRIYSSRIIELMESFALR